MCVFGGLGCSCGPYFSSLSEGGGGGQGHVAPFDAAIVFMLIGGAIMMATWPENYGDSGRKNLTQQFEKAWHAITTGMCWGRGLLQVSVETFA